MDFILNELAFETTRRCNIKCAHCMRGESQNIDLTKETIDVFFKNNNIKRINSICFSGGEPTLNPEIIIYTIDKIIEENINVCQIVMVTNGQVFNKELVEAFNRFNNYRNQCLVSEWHFRLHDKDLAQKAIERNRDEHVRITFSKDQYHKETKKEVEEAYLKYSKGLKFTDFYILENQVLKTGFATTGNDFHYQLKSIEYTQDDYSYFILDNIYITAKGYITSEGMGQYVDMDNINLGHVSEITIEEMLANHGNPIFNTPKIILNKLKDDKKYKKV